MERKLIITDVNDKLMSLLYENDKMVQADVIGSINEATSFLGNIYVARVENVVKNINAAFVEIQKGVKCYYSLTANEKHIFLNRKNNDKVNIGDLILVQVEKDVVKTKMAVAGCNINIGGRYVAVTSDGKLSISKKITDDGKKEKLFNLFSPLITDNLGFVLRTAAYEADEESVMDEALKLKELLENIYRFAKHRTAFSCMYSSENQYYRLITEIGIDSLSKIITDKQEVFDDLTGYVCKEYPDKVSLINYYNDRLLPLKKLYSIETVIDNALKKRVWLKSGGYLIIEPTEALVVVDVNTGKADMKKNREETFLKVNVEAAREIAYQIRLRNYSGIIIIDFIGMESKENKNILLTELETALSNDRIKTNIVDITKLGLVELTRKKVKRPLHEQLKCSKEVYENEE